MTKTPTQIKSLARSHTESAINVLVGIMERSDASEPARVAAANSLLDRGWGKAAQILAGDEDDGPVKFEVIKRVIVDPDSNSGNPDSTGL